MPCTPVYAYVRKHTCVRACLHIYVCTYISICICVQMCVVAYTYNMRKMYIYVHVCIYTHMRIRLYLWVYVHVVTYQKIVYFFLMFLLASKVQINAYTHVHLLLYMIACIITNPIYIYKYNVYIRLFRRFETANHQLLARRYFIYIIITRVYKGIA